MKPEPIYSFVTFIFTGTIRVLTQEGMMVLEKEYKKCKYITKLRKETLAAELNISVAQVTVWFHNRRNYEMRNQHRTRTVPPQQCYIMQNVPPAAVITEPKVEEEEIDIASPSTWGYTSADFGYSFTYNQAKPQVNSSTASTAPTASPSISTDEYDFFADF